MFLRSDAKLHFLHVIDANTEMRNYGRHCVLRYVYEFLALIRLRGGKEQIQITHWHFHVTQSSSDVWHLQKKLRLFRPGNFLVKVFL